MKPVAPDLKTGRVHTSAFRDEGLATGLKAAQRRTVLMPDNGLNAGISGRLVNIGENAIAESIEKDLGGRVGGESPERCSRQEYGEQNETSVAHEKKWVLAGIPRHPQTISNSCPTVRGIPQRAFQTKQVVI